MDGRTQDYSPSGLSSPYTTFAEPRSERVFTIDSGSGTHYHPHQPPNIKYEGLRSPVINNLRTSIPPTPNSEYSSAQSSARPTSFPDYTTSQQQHRAYTEAGPLRYQPPTPQEIAHHTPQTHASMSHPSKFHSASCRTFDNSIGVHWRFRLTVTDVFRCTWRLAVGISRRSTVLLSATEPS